MEAAGYKTYSMSVSDVVIMNQDGQLQAYYVDSFGFEVIPDFVKKRQVALGIISESEMVDFSKVQEGISFYAADQCRSIWKKRWSVIGDNN